MYYQIDAATFQVKCALKVSNAPILSTLHGGSSNLIAAPCMDSSVYIIDSEKCVVKKRYKIPDQNVYHAAISHDLEKLAYSGTGKFIGVIDLQTNVEQRLSQSGNSHYFWYLHQTKQLVSGDTEGSFYSWDYRKGTLDYHKMIHNNEIYCISADQEDKHLLTTSKDRTIQIWDLTERKLVSKIQIRDKTPVVAMFRPFVFEYAACFDDGTIAIIDPNSGIKKSVKAHQGNIVSLHYNSEGKYIVTAGFDGIVKLWNAVDLTLLNELRIK